MAQPVGYLQGPVDVGRRRMLTGGIIGMGTLIGLAYTALAIRYIFPANQGATTQGGSQLQTAGKVTDFKVNVPALVEYKESTGIPTGIFVVNKGGDKFQAFDFHCTHLQCPITAIEGNPSYFACPCHGSQFNLDGTV